MLKMLLKCNLDSWLVKLNIIKEPFKIFQQINAKLYVVLIIINSN